MLSAELVDVLESGPSMLIATRDAQRMPECTRAVGVVVRGSARITIYVPRSVGARAVANLATEPRIALTFSRPHDHRTYQLKGTTTAVRDAGDDERAIVEAYRASFAVALDVVGIPRRVTMRVATWPAVAIDLDVTDVFDQTPGPAAGARLS
ncbi:pyridoxamine 5'-phosphate oxidase family protein [Sandaracinus amylolyticus]|uniref:pyridoxamine 5'-phosphate oxidase family protein n=1 Tax=Sandaracinus amylolyticus TaxID=927083 RepID=UPI001F24263F|nr:pyridoxamine 5'-phosphate oxidase family protein [Sandaracinus amylolyticus]UJR86559.1 Hypothetical protein I5071_86600 [Sandaracinus amylolyticus]